MKKILFTILFCSLFLNIANSQTFRYPATDSFWNSVHMENWDKTIPVTDIPFNQITHLIYFAGLTGGPQTNTPSPYWFPPTGGYSFTDSYMLTVRDSAHAHGTRIIIDLGLGGGWSNVSGAGDAAINTWAGTVAHYLKDNNFDGADFNCEQTNPVAANMQKMYKRLRDSLVAIHPSKTYSLSASCMANSGDIQVWGLAGGADPGWKYLDQVNPMFYDVSGTFASPLYNDPNCRAWGSDSGVVAMMEGLGIPKAKIGLGYAVQVYRTYNTTACPPGSFGQYAIMRQNTQYFPPAAGATVYWNDVNKQVYMMNTTAGLKIAYEDTVSTWYKADFIKRNHYGGAMGFCLVRGWNPAGATMAAKNMAAYGMGFGLNGASTPPTPIVYPKDTITATAGSNGSITPSGTVIVDSSSSPTFTMSANAGYVVDSVTVDGSSVGAVTTYTFTSISTNHTIDVQFKTAPPQPASILLVRDAFDTTALTTLAGRYKWVALTNTDAGSGTMKLNADSTISPSNTTGNGYFGGVAWDSLFTDTSQVGIVVKQKAGNGINSTFWIYFRMNGKDLAASNGYRMKYFDNPTGTDQIVLQRVSLGTQSVDLATMNREILVGDTLVAKVDADKRMKCLVYGATRDSIIVTDNTYNPTTWYAWIRGCVFATPLKLDNFMVGRILQPVLPPDSFPTFSYSPTLINFDSTKTDTTKTSRVVIANPGLDTLKIYSVAVGTTQYSITPSSMDILPGANGAFLLSFTPTSTGTKNDTIIFNHNAAGTPDSIPLTGVGILRRHTIIASITNGTFDQPDTQEVAVGTNITYNITPSDFYHVSQALDNGLAVLIFGNAYTFTNVAENHTFAVTCVANTPTEYTITPSAGAHGTITPGVATIVLAGNSQGFSITPDLGYVVDSVFVDDTYIGAPASYLFEGVQADHTLRAVFKLRPITQYTISVTAGANGSINPGTSTVDSASDLSFAVLPNSGYVVDSIIVDNIMVGTSSPVAFDSIVANHTLRATFKTVPAATYTITATAGTGGSITPSGVVEITSGSDTAFVITADTDYQLDSVIVDGVYYGASPMVEFTNVVANHTVTASFIPTVYPPPDVPILSTPQNGSTGLATPVTLTWNSSSNTTYYGVQLSTASAFTTLLVDDSTLTGTSKLVSVTEGNKYFWRVRAKNAVGTSQYSAPWSFTTPQLVYTTIYDNTLNPRWSEGSWGYSSLNYSSTTQVKSGTSIKMTFLRWGGLDFVCGTKINMVKTVQDSLSFWVYPSQSLTLTVGFYMSGSERSQSVTANQWNHVTVRCPNKAFSRFYIKNATAALGMVAYFDDIIFRRK